MTKRRDDFAWIVDLIDGRRRESGASRPRRGGYESVDQILERRAGKKKSRRVVVQLLIQMLPIIVMLLFLLLS